MNKTLNSVYNKSPVWFQNIMVNTYGYMLKRQRYGGKYEQYLNEVNKTQWWPEDALRELQNRRLQALVKHSCENTKYYRNLFNKLGLKPEDFCSKEDLKKLPILTRDNLRANFKDIIDGNYIQKGAVVDYTSGTTGTPRKIYINYDCLQYSYALYSRAMEWFGLGHNPRKACLGGRLIVPVRQTKPPFWRFNMCDNQLLLSAYHITEQNTKHYVKRLMDFVPEIIDGYPSNLYTLARFMKRLNFRGVYPKVIFSNSEMLLDSQRKCIEEQFRCAVYDWYGNSESACVVIQCPDGGYHISDEFCIIEIINDAGAADTDTIGKVVCTGLFNYAMPLIRYEVGDLAALSNDKCSCGRSLSLLKCIEGRIEDSIVTADGRVLVIPIFKEINNVAESQIIQESQNRLKVRVVKERGYSDKDSRKIIDFLADRVGRNMKIEIEFTESIERTKSGKFRFIVSRLNA